MSIVEENVADPLTPPLVTERVVVDEPYPGAASYRDTPADRALFAGREAERVELLNLVLSESLVVLLGRSGMGKSSLINARLLTDLRAHRFFPIAARVTSAMEKTPVAAVIQSIHTAAAIDREGIQLATAPTPPADLWSFFHTSEFRSGSRSVRPILIIDQFEELFTRYRPDDPARRAFVSDLADVVRRRVPESRRAAMAARLDQIDRNTESADERSERGRLLELLYEDAVPDVKVVLVIRDDYVAEMLSLRVEIPGILRNSLRLEPLTRGNARDAIVKPTTFAIAADRQSLQFGEGVVGHMLEQLCGQPASADLDTVPCIEPLQLQILCRFLYEHPRKSPTVTLSNLKAWGGLKKAVRGYYRSVMKKLPVLRLGPNEREWRPSFTNFVLVNRPRAAAQTLCERGLIDFSSHRTSLNAPVVIRRFGLTASDLELLVKERLIVEDPRPDTVAYELAHDSLVKPLRAARSTRRLTFTLAILLAIIIGSIVPSALSEWAARRSDLAALREPDLASSDRGLRLASLVRRGEVLTGTVLIGIDGRGLYLNGARLDSANLRRARLDSVQLDFAQLRSASLGETTLEGASFHRADLAGADLVRARGQTNFAYASLEGARLDHASLPGTSFDSTNLSGAVVHEVNLRDARMSNSTIDDKTDFSGTAWWLARDWSDAHIKLLSDKFPLKDFVTAGAYRNDLDIAAHPIGTQRPDGVDAQVWALTLKLAHARRARVIAIEGEDLEAAYQDIEVAYRDTATRQSPEVLDTRAYILLRRTWFGDRNLVDNRRGDAYKNARRAVNLDPQTDSLKYGERLYHLGLSFEGMLDTMPAETMFRRAALTRYVPTYERYLTPSTMAMRIYEEVRSEQEGGRRRAPARAR